MAPVNRWTCDAHCLCRECTWRRAQVVAEAGAATDLRRRRDVHVFLHGHDVPLPPAPPLESLFVGGPHA